MNYQLSTTNRPCFSKVSAFTLLELVVVISIIAIMVSLALPHLFSVLLKGEMMQTLSNERQLYLATQAMAIDASTTGTDTSGWPGDMSAPSFSAWATALCNGYLSTSEFCKLSSAPGIAVPSDKIPSSAHETALTVYAVQEASDGNAIFLITRNATLQGSGNTLSVTFDPAMKPYGNKGCVLIHRAGDAISILPSQAVSNPHALGSLATNASTPLQ